MGYSDPNKTKEWYDANREKIREQTNQRLRALRTRNREYVWEIKANNPCVDCGASYHPCVMDFDHIAEDKSADVSRLVRSSSLERIKEEIAKCELVCSNCHRLRTFLRSTSECPVRESNPVLRG